MSQPTTRLRGRCPDCGVAVEVEAPAEYAGAALIVVTCPACAERQLTDAGGVVLPAAALPPGLADRPPLFEVGRVSVTPGAIAALAEAGTDALALLARHAGGDWGRAGRAWEIQLSDAELRRGPLETSDDGKLNLLSARAGRGRILSSYDLPTREGARIWVLTDLAPGGRAVTTILLPDEY